MIRAKIEGPLVQKVLATSLLVAALLAASLLLTAKPAHANTFSVTNTNDSGNGSLRKAILDANARLGADTIKFSIPGTGVKAISPATELPEITDPVVIDGYTQPGSKKNTKPTSGLDAVILVELSGLNAGQDALGLDVKASNVVVRGLAVNRFTFAGIQISDGATGVKIEGNFIGTDATGVLDRGNEDGVSMKGNVVGDGAGGNNTVGGASPNQRNLISGNNGTAVSLGGTGSNKVQGNLIGVKKDGTSILGGSDEGVLAGSPRNTIGGAVPGEANTIAFNFGAGVRVDGNFSTGNRILNNSIFSNGGLGIDLEGSSGRTANDSGDIDSGANTLQNFPVLSSASTSAGRGTTVTGELDSTPGKTFSVRFFSNPRGEDEGKTFIGQKSVTTNAQGRASFTFQPSQALSGGNVTATATNGGGNTSEFSDPVPVFLLVSEL